MIHGDCYVARCAHCKRGIERIISEEKVARGAVVEFEAKCPHCHKDLYCWARWTVTVDIEKREKVT